MAHPLDIYAAILGHMLSPKTGRYDTPLGPGQDQAYQNWTAANVNPEDNGQDYDFQGAFKAGLNPSAENGHWPDTFKKPNHDTFSNESQYAVVAPWAAGTWDPNEDNVYNEPLTRKLFEGLGIVQPKPREEGVVYSPKFDDLVKQAVAAMKQKASK